MSLNAVDHWWLLRLEKTVWSRWGENRSYFIGRNSKTLQAKQRTINTFWCGIWQVCRMEFTRTRGKKTLFSLERNRYEVCRDSAVKKENSREIERDSTFGTSRRCSTHVQQNRFRRSLLLVTCQTAARIIVSSV